MSVRWSRVIGCAVAFAALLTLQWAPLELASAHSWSHLYINRFFNFQGWPDAELEVEWYTTPNYAERCSFGLCYQEVTFKQRALDATGSWNRLQAALKFVYAGMHFTNYDPFASCDAPPPPAVGPGEWRGTISGLHRRPAGNQYVAITVGCYSDPNENFLQTFQINLNRDLDWYSGTEDAPDDYWDLWAALAHEFGHATGWGFLHYREDDDSSICDAGNLAQHTMCRNLPFNGDISRIRRRTLELHDIHTFQNRYPIPAPPRPTPCVAQSDQAYVIPCFDDPTSG